MNYRFLSWYTQALGSVLGIIACLFGYLNGYMYVYGNISKNIDILGFSGLVSSYLLFPLCICSLIVALFMSISKKGFVINKINLKYFNLYLIVITVIVGFIGTKLYFCIAAIFMLINQILYFKKRKDNLDENSNDDEVTVKNLDSKNLNTKKYSNVNITTQREMARELLIKNADISFIKDITGLTETEINNIYKEI